MKVIILFVFCIFLTSQLPAQNKNIDPVRSRKILKTAIEKINAQLDKVDLGISCTVEKTMIIVDINIVKMSRKTKMAINMFDLLINSLIIPDWKGGGHALRVISTNIKGRISFLHNQCRISIIPDYMGKNTVQFRFEEVKPAEE